MQNPGGRDLAGVALATLCFFALACGIELSEKLNRWASGYERWQLDELPLTLLFLAAGLGWFGWRRLRESRAESRARQQTEQAHRALLEQNCMLTRGLISLQEEERRSLARELHDELGQCCIAIKVEASFLGRHAESASAAAAASARALADTADQVQRIVRGMLRRLRPSALDDLGLRACVQDLAKTWGERHAIACTFASEGGIDELAEGTNITAYRIVQECLTNIAKHSGARRASICMRREPSAGLEIVVEDDGKGLAGPQHTDGLGLLGMAERAAGLGGTLRLASSSLGGLRVEAFLPAHP